MIGKKGTRALTLDINKIGKRLSKSKRSQLTIFIIIAILIIAVVALFFVFRGGIQKEKPASPETAEINSFVQECLDDSLEEVVFRIGEGGGYYFPPKISTPLLEVPYYIKNNKNLMPTKQDIENEISRYVKRELVLCIGNFAQFPEYEITKGEMTAETKIESERVLVDVKYPLTIIKDETKSKIEDFNSEIPVRLGIVYDAVAEFVGQELETGVEGTCVSCLADISVKKDLYASVFDYDNRTSIFIISDFNSKINKEEFVYIFANE